jgi:hypothetical protein
MTIVIMNGMIVRAARRSEPWITDFVFVPAL